MLQTKVGSFWGFSESSKRQLHYSIPTRIRQYPDLFSAHVEEESTVEYSHTPRVTVRLGVTSESAGVKNFRANGL